MRGIGLVHPVLFPDFILYENCNKKSSYETIIYELWQEEVSLNKQNSLKTIVKQLRKKLPVDIIQNVFAFGYIMVLKNDT